MMGHRGLLSSVGTGATLAIGGVGLLILVSSLLAFQGWPGEAPSARVAELHLPHTAPEAGYAARKLVLGRALVRGDAAVVHQAAPRQARGRAHLVPPGPAATPVAGSQPVAAAAPPGPPVAAPAAASPAPAPAPPPTAPARPVQNTLEGVVEQVQPALGGDPPSKPAPAVDDAVQAAGDAADAVGGTVDGLLKP